MKQYSDYYFCYNCACKSPSKRPSMQQLIVNGQQIDEYYLSNLPLRERKNLQKLIRNKSAYDKQKNGLVSTGGGGSDQIGSEYKTSSCIKEPDSCCNYCSCCTITRINRNIKKHPLLHPQYIRQQQAEKCIKIGRAAIRGFHSYPKNIYSEPCLSCYCTASLRHSSNTILKKLSLKRDRLVASGLNKSYTGLKSRAKKVSYVDKFQLKRIPVSNNAPVSLRQKIQEDRTSKKKHLVEEIPYIAKEAFVYVPGEYELYEYRQKQRACRSRESDPYKILLKPTRNSNKPVASRFYLEKMPIYEKTMDAGAITTHKDRIHSKNSNKKNMAPLLRKHFRTINRFDNNSCMQKKDFMIDERVPQGHTDYITYLQEHPKKISYDNKRVVNPSHSHTYEKHNKQRGIKQKIKSNPSAKKKTFANKDIHVLFYEHGSRMPSLPYESKKLRPRRIQQKRKFSDPSLTRFTRSANIKASLSKIKSTKSPYFLLNATRKMTTLTDNYPVVTETRNSEVARHSYKQGFTDKFQGKNKDNKPTKSLFELFRPGHNFSKSSSRNKHFIRHLKIGESASNICVFDMGDSYYGFDMKKRRHSKRYRDRSISTEKYKSSAMNMTSCDCTSRSTQFRTVQPIMQDSKMKRKQKRTHNNYSPSLQVGRIQSNVGYNADFYKDLSTSNIKGKVLLTKCQTDSNLTSSKKRKQNKNRHYLSEHSTLQPNNTDTLKGRSSRIGQILQIFSRSHNLKKKGNRRNIRKRGFPCTHFNYTRQNKLYIKPFNKFTIVNQLGHKKEDYVTKSILKATKRNSKSKIINSHNGYNKFGQSESIQSNRNKRQNRSQAHRLRKSVSFISNTGKGSKKIGNSAPNFRKHAKYQDTIYSLSDNRKEIEDDPYYNLNVQVFQENKMVRLPTLKDYECEPGFCVPYRQYNNLENKHLPERTSIHTPRSKKYSKIIQQDSVLEPAPAPKSYNKKFQRKHGFLHNEDISTLKHKFREDGFNRTTSQNKPNSYEVPSKTNMKKNRITLAKNQYDSMEDDPGSRMTMRNALSKLLSLSTNSAKFRKLRNLRTNRSTRIARSHTIPSMPVELERILMNPPHRRVFTIGSNLNLSIQFYKEDNPDHTVSDPNKGNTIFRSTLTQPHATSSLVKKLQCFCTSKMIKKSKSTTSQKKVKKSKTYYSDGSTDKEVIKIQTKHEATKKKTKSHNKNKKSKIYKSGEIDKYDFFENEDNKTKLNLSDARKDTVKEQKLKNKIHKHESSKKENTISHIKDNKSKIYQSGGPTSEEIIEKQAKSTSLAKSKGKLPDKGSDSTYKSQNKKKKYECVCENSVYFKPKIINEPCECKQEEPYPNGQHSIGRTSQDRKRQKQRNKDRNDQILYSGNKSNKQQRLKSKSTKNSISRISVKSSVYSYDKSTLTNERVSKSFYECEPHTCVPGVCDPNVCYKIFQSKKKQFKHISVSAKADVKSKSVGTVSAFKRCFCILLHKQNNNIAKSPDGIKAIKRSYFGKLGLKTKRTLLQENYSSMETLMPYTKKKFKKSTSQIKMTGVYAPMPKKNKQEYVSDDDAFLTAIGNSDKRDPKDIASKKLNRDKNKKRKKLDISASKMSVEHIYNYKKIEKPGKHEETIKINAKSTEHINLPSTQNVYTDPNSIKPVENTNERGPIDTTKCLQHLSAITKFLRTGLINLPFGFPKILKYRKKDQQCINGIQSKQLLQEDDKLNLKCPHTVCPTISAQPVTTAAHFIYEKCEKCKGNIICNCKSCCFKSLNQFKRLNKNIQQIKSKKKVNKLKSQISRSSQACCATSVNRIQDKRGSEMELSVCKFIKVVNNANSTKNIKLETHPHCASSPIQPKLERVVARRKSVPGFFKCLHRKKNIQLPKQECPICMKSILFNVPPSSCNNYQQFVSAGTKCIKSESEIKKQGKKKTKANSSNDISVKPSPLFDMIVDAKTMKVTNKDEIYRTLRANCPESHTTKQKPKKSLKNKMLPPAIDLVMDKDTANVLNCEQIFQNLGTGRKRNKKTAFTLRKPEIATSRSCCRHIVEDKTPCQVCSSITPQKHLKHCTCCICSNNVDVRNRDHPQNCTCCICRYGCRFGTRSKTKEVEKYFTKSRTKGAEKYVSESGTKVVDKNKNNAKFIAEKNDAERLKSQEPSHITSTISFVQNFAHQLCVKRCFCGLKICAKESEKLGKARTKGLKSNLPPPCVCGSTVCKLKHTRKTPYYKNKEEKKKMKAKKKRQRKERLKKESLARIKKYASKDAAMRRKIKRQDEKAMEDLDKYMYDTNSLVLLAENASDVGRFGINTISRMITSLKRSICHPRDIHNMAKLASANPRATAAKAFKNFQRSGYSGTVARVKNRCAAMQTSRYLISKVEANPVTNYLFHLRDKDPKGRLFKKTPEKEPEPYECSAYMTSLRKKPCLWLYKLCPWFYPHCLSLLSFWRQFTDVILFVLAVGIWSPCILLTEFCRSVMCCFMCAGGG